MAAGRSGAWGTRAGAPVESRVIGAHDVLDRTYSAFRNSSGAFQGSCNVWGPAKTGVTREAHGRLILGTGDTA